MTNYKMIRQNSLIFLGTLMFACASVSSAASLQELDQKIPERKTTFYREMFDQVVYYPLSKPLRWDRLASRWFGKESSNINVFDEVPDSPFFQNRHGKKPMTKKELELGPNEAGPDPKGPWTITKGKTDGYQTGFFIRDSKG